MTEEQAKSLAIDTWRLLVANQRMLADLHPSKRKSAEAKLRNLRRAMLSHIIGPLKQHGISMPDFTGKPYDSNYPIQAVNVDDFANDDILMVHETLEPALIKDGQPLHFAKVILTRIENPDNQPEKRNVSGD